MILKDNKGVDSISHKEIVSTIECNMCWNQIQDNLVIKE